MVRFDWNVVVFGLFDEVYYDQEIVGEFYLDDDIQFEVQVFVVGCLFFFVIGVVFIQRFGELVFQVVFGDFVEVFVYGYVIRDWVIWQEVFFYLYLY